MARSRNFQVDLASGPDQTLKQVFAAIPPRVARSDAGQFVSRKLDEACAHISRDDFGLAVAAFGEACPLTMGDVSNAFMHSVRACGVPFVVEACRRGYGEKLIAWFETDVNRFSRAEAYRPLYVALRAFVRGDRQVLNFDAVTRMMAEPMLVWMKAYASEEIESKLMSSHFQ